MLDQHHVLTQHDRVELDADRVLELQVFQLRVQFEDLVKLVKTIEEHILLDLEGFLLLLAQRLRKYRTETEPLDHLNEAFICLVSAFTYVYSNLFSNFWLISANFERPVLGCIEDDFCK